MVNGPAAVTLTDAIIQVVLSRRYGLGANTKGFAEAGVKRLTCLFQDNCLAVQEVRLPAATVAGWLPQGVGPCWNLSGGID